MKRAVFKVSLEVLSKLLGLPDGMEVTGVMQDAQDAYHNTLTVFVQGDLLPDVGEEEPATMISPIYREPGIVEEIINLNSGEAIWTDGGHE